MLLRRVTIALTALAALLPVSALAEPNPGRFFPAPGEVLTRLPENVEGWFDERLNERAERTTVQVFELSGRRVDLGRPGVDSRDPTHLVAEIERTNRRGVYYSIWRATSARDGTTSTFCTVFFVGEDAVAEARRRGIGLDCRNIRGVPFATVVRSTEIQTPPLSPSPTPGRTGSPTRTPVASSTAAPANRTDDGNGNGDDGSVPTWAIFVAGVASGALMLGIGILVGMMIRGGRDEGGPPPPGPLSDGPARRPLPSAPSFDVEPPPAPRPPRAPFGRPPPRPPLG